MAQLKNLIVSGASRFIGKLLADDVSAKKVTVAADPTTDLEVATKKYVDNKKPASASSADNVTGTVAVAHGGTGATTLASGQALIGNGTNAVTTRSIRNNTVAGSIGWTSAGASTNLLTQNDVAYWDGSYSDSNNNSNLKYTAVGELKAAATHDVETTVANDDKLPTGAAVKAFVEGKGYKTTDTDTWKAYYGTCPTAAATAEKAVTVSADQNFSLRVGAIVGVKFSVTNTAGSVKLNVNSTGAKSIWYNNAAYTGTSTDVTGYANRLIYFMYDGTYWVFMTASNTFNANTYDRTYLSNSGYKAKSAIVAANIIVAGSDGLYFHLKSGDAFDITYPILYASSACNANAVSNVGYIIIPFTVTTTQSISLTAYKAVYIKGTLSGTTFTPVSTTPLTQTIPTTEDGYQYILLGRALNSTTLMYLLPEHPIYEYADGAFQLKGGSGGKLKVEKVTTLPTTGKEGVIYIAPKDMLATGTTFVNSWNNRTGAVVPATGDYNATQITANDPYGILGESTNTVNVQALINAVADKVVNDLVTNDTLDSVVSSLNTSLANGTTPVGALETTDEDGIYTDEWGSFIHKSTNTNNWWCVKNNAKTDALRIYFETGKMVVGNRIVVKAAGDTATFTNYITSGFITTGETEVAFSVPCLTVSGITATATALSLSLRPVSSGYLYLCYGSSNNQYAQFTWSKLSVWASGKTVHTNGVKSITVTPQESFLYVQIIFYNTLRTNAGTTTVTNNTPVVIEANLTVSFA